MGRGGAWSNRAQIVLVLLVGALLVAQLQPERAASAAGASVSLTGPASVRDEKSVTLVATVRTSDPATGASVPDPAAVAILWQRLPRTGWTQVDRLATDARGKARFTVWPRESTRFRVEVEASALRPALTSDVLRVANRPYVEPVRLPAGAPEPRITLPPQPRAVGTGPNAQVSRIGPAVWASMVGRSWHPGCLPRSSLRLLEVNYLGYDGYRHRGEMVVAASIAAKTAKMFSALHRSGIRIRSMYRVDRFGWSHRLQGADDYRSMASGNTSMFNCRWVVGRPGVRSPHASGRALDLNTWENPYLSREDGWVPNQWWVRHGQDWRYAWKSASSTVVRLMARHGFRWTYGRSDFQHFDG